MFSLIINHQFISLLIFLDFFVNFCYFFTITCGHTSTIRHNWRPVSLNWLISIFIYPLIWVVYQHKIFQIPHIHKTNHCNTFNWLIVIFDLSLHTTHVINNPRPLKCVLETRHVKLHRHIKQHHIFLRNSIIKLLI